MSKYSSEPYARYPATSIEYLSGAFGAKLDGRWMAFDQAGDDNQDIEPEERQAIEALTYASMTLFVQWCEEKV